MTTLSIITLIIISAFAIGAYSHFAADSFGLMVCLRENMKRIASAAMKAVIAANIKRMIKLEQLMKKVGKGSGIHYMLSAEWKELRSYNVALGSI